MLTEIEAYEWAIYFKMRSEEMNKAAPVTDSPIKSKHLFVFR